MNDEYLIYGETLKSIADSIRSVSSVSTTWTPDEMAAYILANLVKPTTRQAAKTYTPSTSNQTIAKGTFLTGAATITGEPNYVEGNIKKGTKMWNKTGTLSGIWGVPDTFYGFTAVKSGSFTVASRTESPYTVTHGLGKKPRLVFVYTESNLYDDNIKNSSTGRLICSMGFQTNDLTSTTGAMPSGTYASMSVAGKDNPSSDEPTSYIGYSNATAGNTTYWPSSSYEQTEIKLMYNSAAGRDGNIYGVTTSSFIIKASKTFGLSVSTYRWIVIA